MRSRVDVVFRVFSLTRSRARIAQNLESSLARRAMQARQSAVMVMAYDFSLIRENQCVRMSQVQLHCDIQVYLRFELGSH